MTPGYEQLILGAKSPREALTIIARTLDELAERIVKLEDAGGWGVWDEVTDPHWARDDRLSDHDLPAPAVTITQDGDSSEVVVARPTEEKFAFRQMFEAQSLKLAQAIGDDTQDWNTAYALGGPLWLYHGNREIVMQLPVQLRQVMVADVEEDDPQAAQEMARDILKAACDETGYGNSPALADEFEGGVTRQ